MSEQMHPFDRTEALILNIIQKKFPLVSRPYAQIACELGISEAEVMEKVRRLKKKKVIRRIGGVFNSQALGFVSTLVALSVEPFRLEAVAQKVSSLSGVTHNYQREHHFNLWFTLTAPDQQVLMEQMKDIAGLPGVKRLLELPSLEL